MLGLLCGRWTGTIASPGPQSLARSGTQQLGLQVLGQGLGGFLAWITFPAPLAACQCPGGWCSQSDSYTVPVQGHSFTGRTLELRYIYILSLFPSSPEWCAELCEKVVAIRSLVALLQALSLLLSRARVLTAALAAVVFWDLVLVI